MKLPQVSTPLSVTALIFSAALLTACGGDTGTGTTTTSSGSGSSGTTDSSSDDSATSSPGDFDVADYADLTLEDCDLDTDAEALVCATEAFMATLDNDELDDVQYSWSDSSARTVWSNLPTNSVQRNGVSLSQLSSESQQAYMRVARAALSDQGYDDFIGTLAADEYLNVQGGGSGYGWDLYYIAIFGTPGTSEDWALQLGGHHLAHNITYLNGTGYPTPYHAAAEPKATFTLNSESYAPIKSEGDAMVAMFAALDDLDDAKISGSYGDIVMGPDNGSTSLDDYPTQQGQLVSDLTSDQQALVTSAINEWVGDFSDDISDELMDTYTSATAYANTYIGWTGSASGGEPDVDSQGTYMRIDGPRVWIEVASQGGIVIRNQTHYHTILRDKDYDYANSL